MKDWNQFDRPTFMEVAFSAEKSVEDELDRVSKAEVSTMIISYAVMFIYIALALGKFKGSSKCFVQIKFFNIYFNLFIIQFLLIFPFEFIF